MIYYGVELSFNIFYFIPLVIILFIFTFGFASIFMHFGVFVEDLNKVVPLALRFVFYLSGIFYSIPDNITASYANLLLMFNPVAFVINEFRNVLLYSTAPNFVMMFVWFGIGILLCVIGIRTIYKYENTYVKVMR